MFNRKNEIKPSHLDSAISSLISDLEIHASGSEQYTASAESLKILIELDLAEKAASRTNTIDINTVIPVAGSIAGILMVLSYEHAHVVTSKALTFIPKIKI